MEDLGAKLELERRESSINSIPFLRDEIENCKTEIKNLEAKLLDLENKLKSRKRKQSIEKAFYFVPLIVAVLFTGFLVSHGWAEEPTVSIDYNVGEIIGGLLAGVGALLAGIKYAFRGE